MSEADVAELTRAREAVERAENTGRLELMQPLFGDDLVVMAPGMPTVKGPAAAAAFMTEFFRLFELTVKYSSEEIVVAGDWAVDRGTAYQKLTPRSGGPAIAEHAQYLWIYRRDAQGAWKQARVTWNMTGPAD